MRKIAAVALLAFASGFIAILAQREPASAPLVQPASDLLSGPVLMHNQADFDWPIKPRAAVAQRWFNQGMVLAYGFNHFEAERAFVQATQIDPDCAMCWWGAAWSMGPHINAGMDPANLAIAREHAQRALDVAQPTDFLSIALSRAMLLRYAADTTSQVANHRYAEAMRQVHAKWPDDINVRVLLAEALMNLHPWDYHDADGHPRAWTGAIEQLLAQALERHPRHPGANHYWVHLLEASAEPQRAEPAARRLLRLVPDAGHFAHAAGQLLFRLGDYAAASAAGLSAVETDQDYIARCRPGRNLYTESYVPHHYLSLSHAAAMQGRSALALDAATKGAEGFDMERARTPGYEALQHYSVMPMLARLRFGRWKELMALPAPAADLLYPNAIWHFSRGLASLRLGQTKLAESELQALQGIAADAHLASQSVWGVHSFSDFLFIATSILEAELAAERGRIRSAIAHYRRAVERESSLSDDHPPPWYLAPRPMLGALMLEHDRPGAAQIVFQNDLRDAPGNPWSLFGLAQSYRAQGLDRQAKAVRARFESAWEAADFELRRAAF